MKQMSLAESGYKRRPKRTRRQQFLAEMDAVIPWQRLVALVGPVQPKMGARGGQQPRGLKCTTKDKPVAWHVALRPAAGAERRLYSAVS